MIYFLGAFLSFFLTYICSIIDLYYVRYRKVFLLVLCLVLCLFAGLRDPDFWPDTDRYLQAYENMTNIFEFNPSNEGVVEIYSEKGFHFISSIVKTFSDSNVVYLLSLSLLTFYFFYKFLRGYCIYPLIGFFIYLSRFFLSRNMMQIRAALAFLVVLCFTNLVTERKFRRFLLIVLLASSIHHSALLFIPAYFVCRMNLSRKQILNIVLIVLLFTILIANAIVLYIVNIPELKAIIYTYVDENSYGYSAGLTNPMIYYQVCLLFIYTYQERSLKDVDDNYYTIRSMYLFGTCLLIVFNLFAVLAGRLSTVFSSYEMLILPSLLYIVKLKRRFLAAIALSLFYALFFCLNIFKLNIE